MCQNLKDFDLNYEIFDKQDSESNRQIKRAVERFILHTQGASWDLYPKPKKEWFKDSISYHIFY